MLIGSAASHTQHTPPAIFLNVQIYQKYLQFTAHKASPAHMLDFIGGLTEEPFLEPIGVTEGKSVSVASLVANTEVIKRNTFLRPYILRITP
jgi:hypothetical protein